MDTFKDVVDILESHTNNNIVKGLEGNTIPSGMLKITGKKEYLKFILATANSLYGKCQYESAIRFYEKLLNYRKEYGVEHIIRFCNNLMRCYAEEGQFENVDRIFKQISLLDFKRIPLDQVFVSFYELAISYYRRGEFKIAMTIVDNAIKGYDDGEISKIKSLQRVCIDIICKLILLKTDILFTINNYSACKRYIEILETLDTDRKLYSYVTFFKGRTAANQGRILDSLKCYRKIINNERFHKGSDPGPMRRQVYLHVSRLFYQIGKYNSSKKYFYKYLTQTRSGRSAISNMFLTLLIGLYNFQEGDFREADSILTRLLGTAVSNKAKIVAFLAKQGLFNLHLAANNLEEAKVTLDTTYKFINGSADDVNRRKLELEWAKYFIAEGSYPRAVEVASAAIPYFSEKERFGELAKLYGVIARAYIIQKEYVQALKAISRQEKIAHKNYLQLDLLEAKLLKIIACRALHREHLLGDDLETVRKLISRKVGGIVHMVIFSKIQGFIQDHTVFLRKNQDLLVRFFLNGLGGFRIDDEEHDIILDYKRKTVYEKSVGEIYMGNKGLLLMILLTLIEKKGQVVSKEDLFEKVWKDLYNPMKHDNLIYININRLRKLIEPDTRKNRYILNTAGGYMFNDAATFLIKSINMDDSLSKRQTEILDFICRNKSVTIREYKERFGISKSSAIRDLKRLKGLGLISEKRLGNKSIYKNIESSHQGGVE